MALVVGSKVRLNPDVGVVEKLCKSLGTWNRSKAKRCGCEAAIEEIDALDNSCKLRFDDGRCAWYAGAALKVLDDAKEGSEHSWEELGKETTTKAADPTMSIQQDYFARVPSPEARIDPPTQALHDSHFSPDPPKPIEAQPPKQLFDPFADATPTLSDEPTYTVQQPPTTNSVPKVPEVSVPTAAFDPFQSPTNSTPAQQDPIPDTWFAQDEGDKGGLQGSWPGGKPESTDSDMQKRSTESISPTAFIGLEGSTQLQELPETVLFVPAVERSITEGSNGTPRAVADPFASVEPDEVPSVPAPTSAPMPSSVADPFADPFAPQAEHPLPAAERVCATAFAPGFLGEIPEVIPEGHANVIDDPFDPFAAPQPYTQPAPTMPLGNCFVEEAVQTFAEFRLSDAVRTLAPSEQHVPHGAAGECNVPVSNPLDFFADAQEPVREAPQLEQEVQQEQEAQAQPEQEIQREQEPLSMPTGDTDLFVGDALLAFTSEPQDAEALPESRPCEGLINGKMVGDAHLWEQDPGQVQDTNAAVQPEEVPPVPTPPQDNLDNNPWDAPQVSASPFDPFCSDNTTEPEPPAPPVPTPDPVAPFSAPAPAQANMPLLDPFTGEVIEMPQQPVVEPVVAEPAPEPVCAPAPEPPVLDAALASAAMVPEGRKDEPAGEAPAVPVAENEATTEEALTQATQEVQVEEKLTEADTKLEPTAADKRGEAEQEGAKCEAAKQLELEHAEPVQATSEPGHSKDSSPTASSEAELVEQSEDPSDIESMHTPVASDDEGDTPKAELQLSAAESLKETAGEEQPVQQDEEPQVAKKCEPGDDAPAKAQAADEEVKKEVPEAEDVVDPFLQESAETAAIAEDAQPPQAPEQPEEKETGPPAELLALMQQYLLEQQQWVELVDPASGYPYYYNQVTAASSWELPACYAQYQALAAQAQMQQPATEGQAPDTPEQPRLSAVTPEKEQTATERSPATGGRAASEPLDMSPQAGQSVPMPRNIRSPSLAFSAGRLFTTDGLTTVRGYALREVFEEHGTDFGRKEWGVLGQHPGPLKELNPDTVADHVDKLPRAPLQNILRYLALHSYAWEKEHWDPYVNALLDGLHEEEVAAAVMLDDDLVDDVSLDAEERLRRALEREKRGSALDVANKVQRDLLFSSQKQAVASAVRGKDFGLAGLIASCLSEDIWKDVQIEQAKKLNPESPLFHSLLVSQQINSVEKVGELDPAVWKGVLLAILKTPVGNHSVTVIKSLVDRLLVAGNIDAAHFCLMCVAARPQMQQFYPMLLGGINQRPCCRTAFISAQSIFQTEVLEYHMQKTNKNSAMEHMVPYKAALACFMYEMGMFKECLAYLPDPKRKGVAQVVGHLAEELGSVCKMHAEGEKGGWGLGRMLWGKKEAKKKETRSKKEAVKEVKEEEEKPKKGWFGFWKKKEDDNFPQAILPDESEEADFGFDDQRGWYFSGADPAAAPSPSVPPPLPTPAPAQQLAPPQQPYLDTFN